MNLLRELARLHDNFGTVGSDHVEKVFALLDPLDEVLVELAEFAVQASSVRLESV